MFEQELLAERRRELVAQVRGVLLRLARLAPSAVDELRQRIGKSAGANVSPREVEAAIAALESAEAALDRATHADVVAAVRSGVKVGDPCPVCGRAIESLPRARGVQALERAKAAHVKARGSAERANEELQHARADRDGAEREAGQAEREATRIEEQLSRLLEELDIAETELAGNPAQANRLLDWVIERADERLRRLGRRARRAVVQHRRCGQREASA
mgnify:CR=1 FL=1